MESWTDITQVAALWDHTVGLMSDGTLVAVGENEYGQCNVDLTDIVQIAAGGLHTVGLKADGTVVAVGLNDQDQCDVKWWNDIIQIAAGYAHTVGLKADGTVVAVGPVEGFSNFGQCDVENWTDIIQVAAGDFHTVGLRSDGTVMAVGNNWYSQCNLFDWQLSPPTLPLMADINPGTVNLKSKGNYVTCYIELPENYNPSLIDTESVRISDINGSAPCNALSTVGPFNVGDNNDNGIPDLMVKFDRQQLYDSLAVGNTDITVSCETYDGTKFAGCDTILVIDEGKDHLSADQSSIYY